jgi:hypothetical protein
MKKTIAILSVLLIIPFYGFSQDLLDALRYSTNQIEGTARAGGMGNAFGALGGDFTSVSINPAGIGLYRSGEFTISPYFGQNSIESSYLNSKTSDSKYNFAFSNISYVGAFKSGLSSESGIVSINFGVGYNRLKDFNSNSIVEGHNAGSSFLDYMAENANYGSWSDFYEELAWKTDVLLKDNNTNEYWHDIRDAGYGQSQQKDISRRGSLDEYTVALGFNFSHKFYAGASLGIQDLNYDENTTLREWDKNGSIPFINDYKFDSYLGTSGTGFNVKLGVIFKPINEIRLGASVHTPTFFRLHDVYHTGMSSSITYDDGSTQTYDEESARIGEYDYDLETPLKATLSGAFIIAKSGLLSIDYEYIDYSKAKLRNGGGGDSFVPQNQDIEAAYKSVGNLRVGGEWKATNKISLRAGYELYPSAYNSQAFGTSQPNSDTNRQVYSTGFGYKQGGFFFDVAFRHSIGNNYDLLYSAPTTDTYPQPTMAKFTSTYSKAIFTFGFRF